MTHPKINKKLIEDLKNKGVVFIDENHTYISDQVEIGNNTIIYPNVIIWDNVQIGKNCIIQANTLITNDVKIFDNVFIGPFNLIREKVKIGQATKIGPHCEIVRSTIGTNCLLGHKNYIGDAVLLNNVKFGAGAIIANTDWNKSYPTFIGENSLVGINTSIIAPKNIGNNALIAAGSVITNDVNDNELAIARSLQVNKKRKK